jgi:hypothetical protein
LTAPRWESTPEHLVTPTEGAAVSARASTATATAPSGTTVAFGALIVCVFVEFVIHYFSFVVNLTITIYRYRTFVKGDFVNSLK